MMRWKEHVTYKRKLTFESEKIDYNKVEYEDKEDSCMDKRKRKDDTSLKKIRIKNPQSYIKGEETLLGGHHKNHVFLCI